MIINTNVNKIKTLIKNKKSFIVCTYYIDAYSNLYAANLNYNLNKNKINIYYLNVEEFMQVCNLNKRIFPIFCIFIDGKLMCKKCGFLQFNELFNEDTKISFLFS